MGTLLDSIGDHGAFRQVLMASPAFRQSVLTAEQKICPTRHCDRLCLIIVTKVNSSAVALKPHDFTVL